MDGTLSNKVTVTVVGVLRTEGSLLVVIATCKSLPGGTGVVVKGSSR